MNPRSFYTNAVATEHYLGIRWPREIWAAVLKQAVDDAINGPSLVETAGHFAARNEAWSVEGKRRFELEIRGAAEDWIADDANEPRRFVWVCEQLGVEPSAVRTEIERRKQ